MTATPVRRRNIRQIFLFPDVAVRAQLYPLPTVTVAKNGGVSAVREGVGATPAGRVRARCDRCIRCLEIGLRRYISQV